MTTTVWHSDQLPQRFPEVHASLKTILGKHGFAYQAIPDTKDIWCHDYMPVRAADGSLVQFVYWPQFAGGLRRGSYGSFGQSKEQGLI